MNRWTTLALAAPSIAAFLFLPWQLFVVIFVVSVVVAFFVNRGRDAPRNPAGAPPAGWYPDPARPGSDGQRYWDGRQWSDLPPPAMPRGFEP